MNSQNPTNFESVFQDELKTLLNDSIKKENIIDTANRAGLLGMAFSGGGIRSATFNLGVLQGLARMGILNKFDYLSTVSGGGYIGSWLAAWIRRECNKLQEEAKTKESDSLPTEEKILDKNRSDMFREKEDPEDRKLGNPTKYADLAYKNVIQDLKMPHGNPTRKGSGGNRNRSEAKPVSHLREFSNYLTPRRGLWSNDAWTLGIAFIRNFALTFSVLLGALFAGVLFIHSAAVLYHLILSGYFWDKAWGVYTAFVLPISAAVFFSSWDMAACNIKPKPKDMKNVTRTAVFFIIVSIWFGGAALWMNHLLLSNNIFELGTLKVLGVTAFAMIICGMLGKRHGQKGAANISEQNLMSKRRIAALFLGIIGLLFTIWLLAKWIERLPSGSDWIGSGLWLAVVWGPLLALLVYSIFAAIFVGAAGNHLTELEREWLARIFAATTKWTVLFCLLTALVLYSPIALKWLGRQMGGVSDGILGLLWAGISFIGAFLARSGGDASSSENQRWITRAVIAIAPAVFMTGLMVLAVCLTSWAFNNIESLKYVLNTSQAESIYWKVVPSVKPESFFACLAIGIAILLIACGWSYLVGVNTFSLHALYGNRLIRAFLGASNLKRQDHAFIGFDPDDNEVLLAELEPGRSDYKWPYLIINAAINLVHGDRLAWQQRKAGSFTFTPLYCGYEFPPAAGNNHNREKQFPGGYASSAIYADGGDGGSGITLGKAMTISGAAASPNMGYHSSSALAFLMTVFNVRLGWWLPNTSVGLEGPKSCLMVKLNKLLKLLRVPRVPLLRRNGPFMGIGYLLFELFGMTNTKRNFVYVSDGGHFENLGIYELVRRRTLFILASDAAADPKMAFGDLGNAIERCRVDFGISIDIDVSQLKRDPETGHSQWHCAVGKIRYSDVDTNAKDGILVYIKASLTGDETQDVAAYATQNLDFPHETTADQWFDEVQFESYRALGQHIVERVMKIPVHVIGERKAEQAALKATINQGRYNEIEDIFHELYKMWYPPTDAEKTSKMDLDAELENILDEMRKDEMLSFLDLQLYPDVERTIQGTPIKSRDTQWVPRKYSELRAGFCFCKRLIQFMQDVYFRRDLDTTYDAPSSRGWMNLLRRWSFSRMLRYTWTMTAGTYRARFQTFCEHHLGLDVGYLKWGDPVPAQHLGEELIKDSISGFDFYEKLLIKEFLDQHLNNSESLNDDARFRVYPLVLETENPLLEDHNACALINAGFAIYGPSGRDGDQDNAILYLRIRPTMRTMGLFNRALVHRPTGDDDKPMRFSLPDRQFQIEDIKLNKRDAWRRRIYREIYSLYMNREKLDWLYRLNLDVIDRESTSGNSLPQDDQERLKNRSQDYK